MKIRSAPTATGGTAALPEERRVPLILRRLFKYSFAVMLPLIIIPMLVPRNAYAKRLSAAKGPVAGGLFAARETQIQNVVDALKIRMSIPETVVVSVVEHNQLVVSVERATDGTGDFSLSIEADFLNGLTRDELEAIVAHELGHVWLFTHHPFLQTEELANEIAMRVVSEETLTAVYDKVWKRVGRKGNLVYLPAAPAAASARQSQ